MSTKSIKTRLKELLNSYQKLFKDISKDTHDTVKTSLKGANTYSLKIPDEKAPCHELLFQQQQELNIRSCRAIYVLIKKIENELNDFNLNIGALTPGISNILQIKRFTEFNIPLKMKYMLPEGIFCTVSAFEDLLFFPRFGSAKDFTIDRPQFRPVNIDKFPLPQFIEEIISIKPIIKKRSEAFPTNLPIERKPVKLLLYNEKELDVFKKLLAEKTKVHKRIVKISSVYNKLDIKNIQNLKYDTNSKKVYFTFRPKKQQTPDKNFAYLVIGRRMDNNHSLSAMVSYSEFEALKYE